MYSVRILKVYVCTYVCPCMLFICMLYAYAFTDVDACVYVCTYICSCVYTCSDMFVRLCVSKHVRMCVHAYFVDAHTCTYVYSHVSYTGCTCMRSYSKVCTPVFSPEIISVMLNMYICTYIHIYII